MNCDSFDVGFELYRNTNLNIDIIKIICKYNVEDYIYNISISEGYNINDVAIIVYDFADSKLAIEKYILICNTHSDNCKNKNNICNPIYVSRSELSDSELSDYSDSDLLNLPDPSEIKMPSINFDRFTFHQFSCNCRSYTVELNKTLSGKFFLI